MTRDHIIEALKLYGLEKVWESLGSEFWGYPHNINIVNIKVTEHTLRLSCMGNMLFPTDLKELSESHLIHIVEYFLHEAG